MGGSWLTNGIDGDHDARLRPWLIRTDRDLFRKVGYQLEAEEIFRGTKHEVEFTMLRSICQKGQTIITKNDKDPPHLLPDLLAASLPMSYANRYAVR